MLRFEIDLSLSFENFVYFQSEADSSVCKMINYRYLAAN